MTAEDEFHEIDILRVNRLHVKDGILVGNTGEKYITIMTTHELAQISLFGTEMLENHEDSNFEDNPAVSLIARGDSALIKAESHYERPDATSLLGVIRRDGKYESLLMIEDLDGKNGVSAD